MATLAKASFPTLLKIGNGATVETFATLGEVISVPDLAFEMGQADATNMSSTAGLEEAIPTKIIRTPVFTLEMNAALDNATQIALIDTKFKAGTISNYSIEFVNHVRKVTFAAFITNFTLGNSIDDKSNLTISFKRTGDYTWAAIV